jgi:hypothetical protein
LEHAALRAKAFPFMMDNSTELQQWTLWATTGTPPKIEPVEDMAKGQLAFPSVLYITIQDDLFTEVVEPNTLSVF